MHAIAATLLGLFLLACGIAHFLAPAYFANLVPPWMPRPKPLVAASGIAEIAVGAMVIVPATRDIGGWLAAAMLAVYLLVWLDRLRTEPGRASAAGVAVNAAYLVWGGYVAVAGG
ncbi:hypothetical protein IU440_11950 [Nocardia cyriacigeorgica]|uniref:DoxX family protein n=1 Tax=Nocardia cyriacigeorgica TaxID=135487 RepID=UPI0018939521|nr:MauE/DoxX family redox-associated membrane protein [Nocardia cyriacigeorgica]MBF6425397.1 hypothetical protein [Nocardia cyriacigeorgica]